MPFLHRFAVRSLSWGITAFARLLTAVQPVWQGIDPGANRTCVYFANHVSHGDFVLLWAVLPPRRRALTRPVAGADYWRKGRLRRFIGEEVFRSLLIERDPRGRSGDPVAEMTGALDEGDSLILFPEGTRNLGDAPLLDFKSGLYWLARARPDVDLVPVWIDNLNRVLPKGAIVPVPLMCRVTFGAPLRLCPDEDRQVFLTRARNALLDLRQRPEAG